MFSMQCSSCLTLRMKFMDQISSNHLQTSKMMKNNGKLRLYSITDDAAKDTNTMSYGKDGQSLMQCGNLPHVSKMVVKPYSKNINADFIYKWTCHHAQQENPNNYLHIPRRRSGRPSYPGSNHSVYLSNTTTSHITPMHHPESIYDVQRCSFIRRNFHCSPILVTTYLTSLYLIQIDIPPVKNFSSKFTHYPSWATNSMYHLIHTLTWSTKCYMTLWNQEGTDTFLTLDYGMTPFSNSNGTLLSISIIQRTCIKVKMNNLKIPTNSEHKWSTAIKEHFPLSHMPKSFLNILKILKTPSVSLPITENMPVFIGLFAKKITNMDFPEMTKTTACSMTKLGKQWPDLFPLQPVQPNMSQHIVQPIPSGSYQQEYCTIVINTLISRPMLLVASNGKSHPFFIEPSFLQTSSPVSAIPNSSPISIPPTIPSPVNSTHQHELFKQLQNLPIWGYLTSTTNSKERLNSIPKVWLPPVEPVSMYKLYDMLNDLAWQHVFKDAINLIGQSQPFELLVALWSLCQYSY